MTTSLTIQAGQANLSASSGNVTLAVGCCSGATTGDVDEFDPGQVVASTLGYGPLVEYAQRHLNISGQRLVTVKAGASISSSTSSVTKVGSHSGPTISVSGTPRDKFSVRIKVTKTGICGVAKIKIALDYYTFGGDILVPAELPARMRGTVDLVATGGGDSGMDALLHGKTFISNPDGAGAATITFDHPTSIEDVADQINDDAGTTVARIVGGSAKYLEVEGVTLGSSGSLDLGAGTANDELGFDANPSLVNGTASTYAIPNTGITLTFAAGTYTLDQEYSFTTVPAQMTIAEMQTALTAFRAAGIEVGKIVIVHEPNDATDARAYVDAAVTTVSAWFSAADRTFPILLMSTPLGTAGSPDANDLAVKNAFSGHESVYVAVAHGDLYYTGINWSGSFRRSCLWSLGPRCAAKRLSADPGNGSFPALSAEGASIVAPDGTTKGRNENETTLKLRSNGFTVVKTKRSKPYFVRGVTRAAPGSLFESLGVLSMAYEAARTVDERMGQYENIDEYLNPNGTIREDVAIAIEGVFNADLAERLIGKAHASAAYTTINRIENISSTKNLTVTWTTQIKGQIESITGTLSLVGALALSEPEAAA